MALDPSGSALKQKMQARIISALAREFKEEMKANPEAQKAHKKMAAAISDIAMDIVTMLLSEVQVQVTPGIAVATVGSPAAQTGATTAPGMGKLM